MGLGSLSAVKYKTERGVLVLGAEVTAYNWYKTVSRAAPVLWVILYHMWPGVMRDKDLQAGSVSARNRLQGPTGLRQQPDTTSAGELVEREGHHGISS